MAAFFAFGGTPVDVEIKLQGEEDRRQVEVKGEKDKKDMCPVYYDGESVVGTVGPITPRRGLWQRLTFR
jgi:vacuolar protein sorting-associated protein 26